MATVSSAATVFNTTAGDKVLTVAPSPRELIIVIAASSGLAGGTTNVTDDNTDGRGTYTQIGSDFTGFSTTGVLTAWVRNALIGNAVTTNVTLAQTGSTGGGGVVYRVAGMSIVGLGAIRGAGGESSGGAGGTPAPVLLRRVGTTFSGTQAALTGNAMIGAVCNGTNSTTTCAPPAGWSADDFDNGYNSPPTGMEVCKRDSGETNSTITFGATTASAFASMVVELDASVPQYDWVQPGEPDKPGNILQQGAVGRAATRMKGMRREWKRDRSGILVPDMVRRTEWL